MILRFKKLHERAQLPVYATSGAAGMDLHTCLDAPVTLMPGEAGVFPTGVAVELEPQYEATIRGRSGLAFKHAIFAHVGTLDSDFRGEIKVLLINHSKVPFTIEPDMRIAQMVVNAVVVPCRPRWVDELGQTERGEGGFGSTGLKAIADSDVDPLDFDTPGFEDSKTPYAITEKAMNPAFFEKIQPDHIPFTELPKTNLTNEIIMQQLLAVSKGKK